MRARLHALRRAGILKNFTPENSNSFSSAAAAAGCYWMTDAREIRLAVRAHTHFTALTNYQLISQ